MNTEKCCQTDEDLIYNYSWSKYYQHFINYYLSCENLNKTVSESKTEENENEKLDAESIKKIAQSTMENRGFIYDSRSGFYYDTQNALYYNQDTKLYFDIENGINYHYLLNKKSNTYHLRYHSKILKNELLRLKRIIGINMEDEQGKEITESECSSESEPENYKALKYPPCIRAILIESNLEDNKQIYELGSLFLIPYTGGMIGSSAEVNRKKYVLDFPSIYKIDEFHASLKYNKKRGTFSIKDENSTTGTFLNGKKIEANEEINLLHGDKLNFGQAITLLIHIHDGSNTCINCEPGEVMHKLKKEKDKSIDNIKIISEKNKEDLRRENVKLIKSKYGLKKSEDVKLTINSVYNDRAKQRRDEHGVDYSHIESINVPSKSLSVDSKNVDSNKNIGLKLMTKMGWKEGKGLGKEESGIIEPISTKIKLDKSGIGAESKAELDENSDEKQKRKILNWKKTKERFEATKDIVIDKNLATAFNISDEEVVE